MRINGLLVSREQLPDRNDGDGARAPVYPCPCALDDSHPSTVVGRPILIVWDHGADTPPTPFSAYEFARRPTLVGASTLTDADLLWAEAGGWTLRRWTDPRVEERSKPS